MSDLQCLKSLSSNTAMLGNLQVQKSSYHQKQKKVISPREQYCSVPLSRDHWQILWTSSQLSGMNVSHIFAMSCSFLPTTSFLEAVLCFSSFDGVATAGPPPPLSRPGEYRNQVSIFKSVYNHIVQYTKWKNLFNLEILKVIFSILEDVGITFRWWDGVNNALLHTFYVLLTER